MSHILYKKYTHFEFSIRQEVEESDREDIRFKQQQKNAFEATYRAEMNAFLDALR